MEALKILEPHKASGQSNFNAGPLPTELRGNLNDQSTADNGFNTRVNVLSRSRLPTTSGPMEDNLAWVSIRGSHAPLDLSLKLTARFSSPDSFHWCARSPEYNYDKVEKLILFFKQRYSVSK